MPRTLLHALTALALLTVAACGDDPEEVASPATTEADGEVPARVVSLSPTGTETLFALGAGDAVVAADEHSNHPAEAPTTDLSSFEPNVEAVAGYDPDLVLLSGDNEAAAAALEQLGVEVLLLKAATDVEDAYDQMRTIGEAVGREAEAEQLVSDVEEGIDEAVASAGGAGEGLRYYYELDPSYYSVTSGTFIGQLLGLLGLENIADGADAEASDYPQLSAEYIVQQDPDLILLADTTCCAQDAAAVGARDGWQTLRAVANGGVVELDDDVASRWGPRIVDLVEDVAEAARRVAV